MSINIKFLLTLFITVVIAYISTSIIGMNLPMSSVEFQKKNILNQRLNQNVDLKYAFGSEKQNSVGAIQSKSKFLDTIKLLGIYDLGLEGGYIIVMEKSSSKTHIIEKNQAYKGYKLVKVYRKYALFQKGSKKYKLPLDMGKSILPEQDITYAEDNSISISRGSLDGYLSNVSKIWKNISVIEHKVDNNIDGF